jgi:hypothetical protein
MYILLYTLKSITKRVKSRFVIIADIPKFIYNNLEVILLPKDLGVKIEEEIYSLFHQPINKDTLSYAILYS